VAVTFYLFYGFPKAFDRVNYRRLFNKLLDDGINIHRGP